MGTVSMSKTGLAALLVIPSAVSLIAGVGIGGVSSSEAINTAVSPSATVTITSASTVTVTKTMKVKVTSKTLTPTPKRTTKKPVVRTTKKSSIPSGATAVCEDGSYSYSQSRRGTCSRHGGVSRWL